ncbi:MAG: hypothetical protein IJ391_09455 [Clostridia bacterium]|nr:hypothetical protein [Clostridia bacterium]
MKKLLLIILALVLVLAIAACGKDEGSDTDTYTEDTVIESDTVTQEADTSADITDTDTVIDASVDTAVSDTSADTAEDTTEAVTTAAEITEAITMVPDKAVEIVGSDVAKDINNVEILGGAEELLSGVTDIIYADMSEEDKQAFVQAAAEDGFEVTFGDDGTTTIIYEDGTKAVQNTDGTITIVGNGGFEGQIGGEWPENDHTKLIPEPEAGNILTSELEDGTFTIMLGGCTIHDAITYTDLLQEKGFDSNVTADDSMFDEGVFSFRAENRKKNAVATVNYISDTFIITVTK